MHSKLRYAVTLAGMTCVTPLLAASFIEDSKVRLDIRNFYYNADFRDGTGVSKREEWAQGFLLNYESGFTQGDIGNHCSYSNSSQGSTIGRSSCFIVGGGFNINIAS